MSSFVYTRGAAILAGAGNWSSDVFRALLERSTSTYAHSRDHDYVSDLVNLVEITVASYARVSLAGKAILVDDTNKQVGLDFDDPAFGNLEAGQTVKSLIIYRQVGGSDATPADDELILRFDGKIDVTLAANAALNATTIYVEPLIAALSSGAALDFGGGATCSLSANAAIGVRSLSVTALGAAATAGAVATDVPISGNILPFALGGGAFNVLVPTAGGLLLKPR